MTSPEDLEQRAWEVAAPAAVVDLYWPRASHFDGMDLVVELADVLPQTRVVLLLPDDVRLRHHLAEAAAFDNVHGAVGYSAVLHDRARAAVRTVLLGGTYWDDTLRLLEDEPELTLAEVLTGSVPLRRAVLSFLAGVMSWKQIGEDANLGASRARNTLDDSLRRKLSQCDPALASGFLDQKRFIAWMAEIRPYLYSWARRNCETLDTWERERLEAVLPTQTDVGENDLTIDHLSGSAS